MGEQREPMYNAPARQVPGGEMYACPDHPDFTNDGPLARCHCGRRVERLPFLTRLRRRLTGS